MTVSNDWSFGGSEPREVLDDVETITSYPDEMGQFVAISEQAEPKRLIRSVVEEITVAQGHRHDPLHHLGAGGQSPARRRAEEVDWYCL